MRYCTTLLLITALAALVACGPAAEEPAAKPNVLLLLVDDWGWTDAGVAGSDLYRTPSIDQLAADGMMFTHAYAACTVCSPTRAAMMTGQYPGRTNVTDWIPGHHHPYARLKVPDWTMKLEHERTSLAEAMKAGGYNTAHVGKWHLMPTLEPETMNDYLPERHGFDINIGGNEYGAPPTYFHPYKKGDRSIGTIPPGGQDGDYLTDRLTDEAIKIIEGWKDSPFFMYFAYYNVHTPIMAREDDIAVFEPLVKPGMRHTNPTYAGMVASVDRSLGRLRRKLEELGIADSTIIMMTGDNGGLDRKGDPTENAPVRAGKGSAYEGGVRVPAFVYAPGVTTPGSKSDEPVITVDYYPTILALTGVAGDAAHNAEIDGINIEPVLRDPALKLERDTLYWHYPHYHNQGATPHSAIRVGDYRLVEFYEDNHAELYNLKEDAGEAHDLIKEMPEKAKELSDKLHQWRAEVGAQAPSPNPDYDPKRAGERAPYNAPVK